MMKQTVFARQGTRGKMGARKSVEESPRGPWLKAGLHRMRPPKQQREAATGPQAETRGYVVLKIKSSGSVRLGYLTEPLRCPI